MATIDKLTLNVILDSACPNPENFEDYSEWQQKYNDWLNTDPDTRGELEEYKGWYRYEIRTHCVAFTVIAKRLKNGGYAIKDTLVRDI